MGECGGWGQGISSFHFHMFGDDACVMHASMAHGARMCVRTTESDAAREVQVSETRQRSQRRKCAWNAADGTVERGREGQAGREDERTR